VDSSGGHWCTAGDAAGLIASLRQVRAPAPASRPRDPWVVASGIFAALCGVFFLLRGRGT
jgi:hypothetical protein